MPLYTCLLTRQCPSTSKVNENPVSSASWCKYQKDKANHTNLFKYGPGLPLAVIVKLKLNIPNLVRKLAAEVLAWQDVKSKWVFEWDGVTKDSKEIYIERKMELELHNAILTLVQLLLLSFSKPLVFLLVNIPKRLADFKISIELILCNLQANQVPEGDAKWSGP